MLFSNERTDLRYLFLDAWEKYRLQQSLEPLEQQLVDSILQHPEYQPLFEDASILTRDFTPGVDEQNPFLHLALHQTILEQVSTDLPAGITSLYHQLVQYFGDPHIAEHEIMAVLAEIMWDILQKRQPFDEKIYLKKLAKIMQ